MMLAGHLLVLRYKNSRPIGRLINVVVARGDVSICHEINASAILVCFMIDSHEWMFMLNVSFCGGVSIRPILVRESAISVRAVV